MGKSKGGWGCRERRKPAGGGLCCGLLLSIGLVLAFAACGGKEAAMQREAKEAEPLLMDADELVEAIAADSTHYKVVYLFSHACRPCEEHLRNEFRDLYQYIDTNKWRVYLVAELNGLHDFVPDSSGDFVELPLADNIRHFVGEYRRKLPALGYDMKDVYFLYDARWETGKSHSQSRMVQEMFTSDHSFRTRGGIPLLMKADPHNRLQTWFVYELDPKKAPEKIGMESVAGAVKETYYVPNEDYSVSDFDWRRHDTIIVVEG